MNLLNLVLADNERIVKNKSGFSLEGVFTSPDRRETVKVTGIYNAPSFVSELSAGVDLVAGTPSFVVCISDLEKAISEGKISKKPQKPWRFDIVVHGKMRKFYIGYPPKVDEVMQNIVYLLNERGENG